MRRGGRGELPAGGGEFDVDRDFAGFFRGAGRMSGEQRAQAGGEPKEGAGIHGVGYGDIGRKG
jgi:hypothetical protein